jgi:hypothetical protein
MYGLAVVICAALALALASPQLPANVTCDHDPQIYSYHLHGSVFAAVLLPHMWLLQLYRLPGSVVPAKQRELGVSRDGFAVGVL